MIEDLQKGQEWEANEEMGDDEWQEWIQSCDTHDKKKTQSNEEWTEELLAECHLQAIGMETPGGKQHTRRGGGHNKQPQYEEVASSHNKQPQYEDVASSTHDEEVASSTHDEEAASSTYDEADNSWQWAYPNTRRRYKAMSFRPDGSATRYSQFQNSSSGARFRRQLRRQDKQNAWLDSQ